MGREETLTENVELIDKWKYLVQKQLYSKVGLTFFLLFFQSPLHCVSDRHKVGYRSDHPMMTITLQLRMKQFTTLIGNRFLYPGRH